MSPWSRCLASVLATLALVAPAWAAKEPSLSLVIERAGNYVAELQRQLSSIVTEEDYVQTVWNGKTAGQGEPTQRVELLSDLILVRPEGADRYVELRDTFEVDGRPVHDHRGRLARLVSEDAAPSSIVQRIIDESARYNIGDVQRTLNVPTLPLLFLHPRYQWRFRFQRTDDTPPILAADKAGALETPATFRTSTEVWTIAYREVERPTLIRSPDGRRNRPVHGRLWIEPASGRVLMSELIAGDDEMRAAISVSYQSQPLLGFLIPIEMRERYDVKSRDTVIEGVATYARR